MVFLCPDDICLSESTPFFNELWFPTSNRYDAVSGSNGNPELKDLAEVKARLQMVSTKIQFWALDGRAESTLGMGLVPSVISMAVPDLDPFPLFPTSSSRSLKTSVGTLTASLNIKGHWVIFYLSW